MEIRRSGNENRVRWQREQVRQIVDTSDCSKLTGWLKYSQVNGWLEGLQEADHDAFQPGLAHI